MVVSVAQRTGELTEASKARLVGLVQFLDAGVDDGNRTLVFLPINLRDAINGERIGREIVEKGLPARVVHL